MELYKRISAAVTLFWSGRRCGAILRIYYHNSIGRLNVVESRNSSGDSSSAHIFFIIIYSIHDFGIEELPPIRWVSLSLYVFHGPPSRSLYMCVTFSSCFISTLSIAVKSMNVADVNPLTYCQTPSNNIIDSKSFLFYITSEEQKATPFKL